MTDQMKTTGQLSYAAHPEGSPALPIRERAELRAAARNLEPALAAA